MLYVLSRTIEGGTAAGVASTLGTALGGLIHVVAAAMGLSALLAVFPLSFVLIKYVGAVFLAYLGVRMLISANRTGRGVDGTDEKPRVVKVRAAFRQGIITEILNPKVALFFLTFIPQFISRSSENVIPQFLLLGTLVVFFKHHPGLHHLFLCGADSESMELRSSIPSRTTTRFRSYSRASGLFLGNAHLPRLGGEPFKKPVTRSGGEHGPGSTARPLNRHAITIPALSPRIEASSPHAKITKIKIAATITCCFVPSRSPLGIRACLIGCAIAAPRPVGVPPSAP